MHSSPSIVPDQDDRDIYFVLDDFGGRPAGSIASTVESDPEGRQREKRLLDFSTPIFTTAICEARLAND